MARPPQTKRVTKRKGTEKFGQRRLEVRNAMSLHHHGRKARVALDVARDLLRDVLDFPKAEVVYTSGGTEADNLAIFGFARQARAERGCDRLVLSPWEHPAVVEPMMALQSEGFLFQKPSQRNLLTNAF